ncbi:hypothetical protein, partial [Sinorhizobium medicae]|uniref:hypothetical protein n=1 Tax=Sinorhizobium medicae TaxID=110321 RepID=UPI001304FEE9
MLSDGGGIISESGGDYFSELGGEIISDQGADCLGICNQRRFPDFDDKIISMYARGMTVREKLDRK